MSVKGSDVKFYNIDRNSYDNLPDKDESTVYFVESDNRHEILLGDKSYSYNIKKLQFSIPLFNIPRSFSNGYFSDSHLYYGRSKSNEGLIDLVNASKVSIDWDNSGAVPDENRENGLRLYWYDSNYALVSKTDTTDISPFEIDVPEGGRYLVIFILNGENIIIKNTVTITTDGSDLRFTKMPDGEVKEDGFLQITYEVEKGIANSGRLMLPFNYSPSGVPVPGILFVHGSNSFENYDSLMSESYRQYWFYLRNCGYAIMDCWGWTTKYVNEVQSSSNTMSNPYTIPVSVKAYNAATDFFCRNFNIDKDNLFVMCKSLGGHMAEVMLSTGKFKAGSLLAPALVYTGGNQYSTVGYNPEIRSIIASDLGLRGDVDKYINGTFSSNEGKDFWRQNIDKISGFMPNWIGLSGCSALDKLEEDMSRVYTREDLCMTNYPPTKIWVATDDTIVNQDSIKAVVRNIRNGGQYAEVRYLPENTGAHHAVDSSDSALKNEETIVTALGITYNPGTVPLAYVEAEEFIRKYLTSSIEGVVDEEGSEFVILQNPTDVTLPINSYAIFTVKAKGKGLTYMWQSNTTGEWKNTSFASSRTSSLTALATSARNGKSFRCVIKDHYGRELISEPATMTVVET